MNKYVCKKCGNGFLKKNGSVYECEKCHAIFQATEVEILTAPFSSYTQLDTIYYQAEQAMAEKDFKAALCFFQEAKNIDSDGWKATFNISYCKCMILNTDSLEKIVKKADKLGDTSGYILRKIQAESLSENELYNTLAQIKSKLLLAMENLGLEVFANMQKEPSTYLMNNGGTDDYNRVFSHIYCIGYGWGNDIINIFSEIAHDISVELWEFTVTRQNNFEIDFHNYLSIEEKRYNRDTVNTYVSAIKSYRPDYKLKYSSKKSSGGCYVATCVYGSYDCPQVWVLRRYRDTALATTWYGRLFIRLYYFASPKVVHIFGNSVWFKAICKRRLDIMVSHLQAEGFEDSPYQDIRW